MGQGLSNIEACQLQWNTPESIWKYTDRQENVRIKYALSSMQGLCPYMEDAHAAILDLDGARSTSFFGVYDGHGGANVAKYCAEKLHTELLLDEGYPNDLGNALGRVFSRMDVQLKEYDEWRALANPQTNLLSCLKTPACVQGTPKFEGSTACVALIRGYEIIVGNVGDSRCVLSRNGQVIFYFKSNETLLPTEQAVTCNPDIRTEAITHDTDFLLIASDGIWDFVSSQEAVNFVQEKFAGGTSDLRTICEELLDHCYSSKGNSTVILVQFRHAARLPHPAPDLPVAHPTDAGGSSNPSSSSAVITQDTGADAKTTTDTKRREQGRCSPSA